MPIQRLVVSAAVCAIATALFTRAASAQTAPPVSQSSSTLPERTNEGGAPVSTAPSGTVAAPPTNPSSVAEVVVTAQRRSENIQTTPIAITALSGQQLENRNVRDMTDLQFVAPALSLSESAFQENINIRGIGLNVVSPTVVSGVAVYRDGLFYPGSIVADEPYYDIADVEVLRGPQGTFVGQNSTGGAILTTSRDPNFDGLHGFLEAQGGNYADLRVQGSLNLPITDTLVARVAIYHESRDSFYTDIGDSSLQPGRIDQTAGRLSLLWKPNDALSVLFKTALNQNTTDGYPEHPIASTAYARLAPSAPFTLDSDRDDLRNDERSIRTGLEIKYRFDNGITLRSMSGFQYADLALVFDNDASPAPTTSSTVPGSYTDQKIKERVTSQEFNLISPDRGFFRWVLGTSYVHRNAPVDIDNITQSPNGSVEAIQGIVIRNPTDATGFFSQTTFELTPSLELQGGLRYSHDWVGSGGSIAINPPGILIPNTQAFSDHDLTGKIGLNWTINHDHFAYVFAAKGYKSGGPNVASSQVFQPETVWDYEAGLKSTLLDRHIRTQIGGFYMEYYNFQTPVFNSTTENSNVENITTPSKIYGAEAQAQAQFGHLGLEANFSYVHSSLGQISLVDTRTLPNGGNGLGPQCATGAASNPPTCFNYAPYEQSTSGEPNPFSPEYTLNIGVHYDIDAFGGTITPRMDYNYTSTQYATVFDNPALDKLDVRHIVNLNLSYTRGPWATTAYVTNLTNQTYVVGESGDNEFFGNPRQVGIRVSRSY
jgi:iron complex outermembrane receptor protein